MKGGTKGRLYKVKLQENGAFKESNAWRLEDLAAIDTDDAGQVQPALPPHSPQSPSAPATLLTAVGARWHPDRHCTRTRVVVDRPRPGKEGAHVEATLGRRAR